MTYWVEKENSGGRKLDMILECIGRKPDTLLRQKFQTDRKLPTPNAVLRLRYLPKQWKLAKISMISEPDERPEKPNSYPTISLLSTISRLSEKCLFPVPHKNSPRQKFAS